MSFAAKAYLNTILNAMITQCDQAEAIAGVPRKVATRVLGSLDYFCQTLESTDVDVTSPFLNTYSDINGECEKFKSFLQNNDQSAAGMYSVQVSCCCRASNMGGYTIRFVKIARNEALPNIGNKFNNFSLRLYLSHLESNLIKPDFFVTSAWEGDWFLNSHMMLYYRV